MLHVKEDKFVGDWVVYSDIASEGAEEEHIVERFDSHQEAIIFAGDHKMMGTKFEKLEQLIEAVGKEHRRLSDEDNASDLDALGLLKLPHEIRWKLHVVACSVEDYTFWAYKLEEEKEWYRVYEVETGVYAEGVSPRHALENYFNNVFPDVTRLPRG